MKSCLVFVHRVENCLEHEKDRVAHYEHGLHKTINIINDFFDFMDDDFNQRLANFRDL